MSIQFTFREKGAAHPERPRRRAAFLLRVQYKTRKVGGFWRVERDDDGELGPVRSTAEVNAIVRRWSKDARAGSRLDLHHETQDVVFAMRSVEVAPPVVAPDIAPPLQLLYVRVFTKYGWVTNLGNWYCRFVRGTRIVSKHGYYLSNLWRGAAQDFGCPDGAHLELLANSIVHWATDPSDPLYGKIATVIVHDRIWQKGEGWQHYGGVYHYHVHVDVDLGVACHP